jgi:hypothetical protein
MSLFFSRSDQQSRDAKEFFAIESTKRLGTPKPLGEKTSKVGHFQLQTCCRMLLDCSEALPVECLDTWWHRLLLIVVSESFQRPHSIGNGNLRFGQPGFPEIEPQKTQIRFMQSF